MAFDPETAGGGVQRDKHVDLESAREEVREMVEQARAELSPEAPSVSSEADRGTDGVAFDPETARGEVQRAVERLKAEMHAGSMDPDKADDTPKTDAVWAATDPKPHEITQSENVTSAWPSLGDTRFLEPRHDSGLAASQTEPEFVGPADQNARAENEQRRSYGEFSAPDSEPAADEVPPSEDGDRREEVRRAVEQARAELSPAKPRADLAKEDEPRSILLASMSGAEGRSLADLDVSPPVLVIENTGGRVELVQVFETLNRVQKSAQAALLNYSPHSISVGLSSLSDPLDPDELVKAAAEVFGKECSVTTQGSEISILVGLREAA